MPCDSMDPERSFCTEGSPTQHAKIEVKMTRKSIPFSDPYEAFCALRPHYGKNGVYLLESLAGPEVDRRTATIGFNALFTLSLKGRIVSFEGLPVLVDRARLAIRSIPGVHMSDGSIEIDEDKTLWQMLRAVQSEFDCSQNDKSDGFNFGFFGFFGYDTIRFVEKLPLQISRRTDQVDICLVIFQGSVQFNLTKRTSEIRVATATAWGTLDTNKIAGLLRHRTLEKGKGGNVPRPSAISSSTTKERYMAAAKTALDYISIGDIYQVQLGQELTIESAITPEDVYLRLRARNPGPYMYFANLGDITLIGASPEVFVRLEGRQMAMRPLAGTIRRGKTEAETIKAAATLRANAKEVAEHVMLVDLCRNDFGRVCTPGSLEVTDLLATELYSHVIHLVSHVIAELDDNQDIYDLIAASFPAGTMTGTPKIRAMEIIEALETTRRGIYAGAIGLIDFNGDANLALCIRTAFHQGGRYFIRASAGIVADSKPEAEWDETLAKLGATYWAITGEEITK